MSVFPAVALATAGAGLVALFGRVFPAGDRAWARLAAWVGLACVAPLAFATGSWRTVAASRPEVVAVAAGAAAAWISVIVRPATPAWRTAALAGVGASAAVLSALGEWSVPAVLFLACAVLACAADMLLGGARAAALGAALGGVAAGVGLAAAGGSDWALTRGAGGYGLWSAIAGVILLAGAAHLVLARRPASLAPLLPLVMLALLTAARLMDRPYPWVGAGILLLGSGAAVLLAVSRREAVAAWAGSVALGAVLVVPEAVVAATLALLLALVALVVPEGRSSYGPLLGAGITFFLPLTAGFVVMAAVARTSFETAVAAPDVASSAPWAAAGAALLGVLGVGLWLAAVTASAAVATADVRRAAAPGAIALLSLLVAAAPRSVAGLDRSPLGAEGGVLLLHVLALGAGIGAAWFVFSREDATIEMVDESVVESDAGGGVPPEPRSLLVLALLVLGLGAAATIWLTINGLRAGFL